MEDTTVEVAQDKTYIETLVAMTVTCLVTALGLGAYYVHTLRSTLIFGTVSIIRDKRARTKQKVYVEFSRAWSAS